MNTKLVISHPIEGEFDEPSERSSPMQLIKLFASTNKLNCYMSASNGMLTCFIWYLGYFKVATIAGNIFINGIIYSFVDSLCQLISGPICNLIGDFNLAFILNIAGVLAVTVQLIF